jgi:hypothetical protein
MESIEGQWAVHKRLPSLAALLVALLSAGQAGAQSSATLVRAGRLLDPGTGRALSPAAVLMKGGQVVRNDLASH